jgi:acetyl-CoA acetyltransferase
LPAGCFRELVGHGFPGRCCHRIGSTRTHRQAAIGVTRELGLDLGRVNVNGGAVALGHPIGASGARILTTLLYEMIRHEVHKGIAALCLGGGDAMGLAVEG